MSNKNENNFGKVLKTLRIVNDYSVADLADKMGISTSEVIEFESNQRQLTLDDITKYSHAFKINKAALVMLLDNEPQSKNDLTFKLYKLLEKIIEKFNIEY